MKKYIFLAVILILAFAEGHIDFTIGLVDTALVMLISLGTLIISFSSAIACLFFKRKNKALTSAVICISVILGTWIGLKVTHQQFQNAQEYVESISQEIIKLEKRKGSYPENLTGLKSFDSSGNVPIGIFRRRPLHYTVMNNKKGFTLWFPYRAWLVAKYNGLSKEWSIDD